MACKSLVNNNETNTGRPHANSIYEAISFYDPSLPARSLRDTTYVNQSLSKFPILSFVNEPMSHFQNASIKPFISTITDVMHERSSVPENISNAYRYCCPFVMRSSNLSLNSLQEISKSLLLPNDGDGIAQLSDDRDPSQPLMNAVFHRLYGIDAPELYSVSFVTINSKTFYRRNGHLSHLALRYFIETFKSAKVYVERTVLAQQVDRHNRPLSSFWFGWQEKPTSDELKLLDHLEQLLRTEPLEIKERVMSQIDPRMASEHQQYFINLNALLVITGFCHVFVK